MAPLRLKAATEAYKVKVDQSTVITCYVHSTNLSWEVPKSTLTAVDNFLIKSCVNVIVGAEMVGIPTVLLPCY